MATRRRSLTYRSAGVDIDAADRLVSRIGALAKSTQGPDVLSGVGLFAAAQRLPRGMRDPVLLTAADGVGTKLAVARLANRHDTVGIDLVAMNVNDLLTCGAKPISFLDYLSVGKLSSIDAESVIAGIAEGCKRAGASLVGGETAEMPGFYPDGEYDLAGFAVGIAEKRALIDGKKIKPGMAILGLAASGLHSNGFSLARRALDVDGKRALSRKPKALGMTLADALLEPTVIYVKPVLAALSRYPIAGMAHITGGGIPGNLIRVLPTGVAAVVDRTKLPESPLLSLIAEAGNIEQPEMDKTFNAGIGLAVVCRAKDADALKRHFRRRRIGAEVIGRTVAGRKRVRYEDGK